MPAKKPTTTKKKVTKPAVKRTQKPKPVASKKVTPAVEYSDMTKSIFRTVRRLESEGYQICIMCEKRQKHLSGTETDDFICAYIEEHKPDQLRLLKHNNATFRAV